MCYSAQIWSDYRKYVRVWGADISVDQYKRLYFDRSGGLPRRVPKAMDASFANSQSDDELAIKSLIDA